MAIKIYNASPGFGVAMNKLEIDNFLQNGKLLLRLGTVDQNGDPVIHPVWYYYMNEKLYIETTGNSQKANNIRRKNTIYFCVDDEHAPYKGVKGKGTAKVIQDVKTRIPIAEKIMIKYTGSLDTPIGKTLMNAVRSGQSVILEVTPKYYSTWDYGKRG